MSPFDLLVWSLVVACGIIIVGLALVIVLAVGIGAVRPKPDRRR